jgi:hypothetical protein
MTKLIRRGWNFDKKNHPAQETFLKNFSVEKPVKSQTKDGRF